MVEDTLPFSLILLVDLHLLHFPLNDSVSYDENLFNPLKRGIGERSKFLEVISFFLVSKIEGSKGSAKKILQTYPCAQPSDTVAYRTSLSKYLEGLRNEVVRSNPSEAGSGGGPSQVAWWWRDVVVRKSLLEECAGERFERLLLALSTHAVWKSTPRTVNLQHLERVSAIHRYRNAFSAFRESRRSWEHAHEQHAQQKASLNNLRNHLSGEETSASVYTPFNTDKLLALKDLRLSELSQPGAAWGGPDGMRCLEILVALAGLRRQTSSEGAAPEMARPLLTLSSELHNLGGEPDLLLPVAAAHFPAELQALRNTSFTLADATTSQHEASSNNVDVSVQFVAQKLAVESHVQASLRAAAERAKQAHAALQPRLKAAMERRSGNLNPGGSDLMLRQVKTRINLDFTDPPLSNTLEFKGATDHEVAIQARAAQMRDSLKPAWPSIPDARPLTPPPLPPVATRLPKLTSKPPASAHVDDPHDNRLHVKFSVSTSTGRQTVSGVRSESGRGSSRVSPRKSNVLAAGKARRSSAFARRKSLAFDQYEVDRIADSFMDESMSDISDPARPHSPTTPHKGSATRGQPLTPHSTIKKSSAPRQSFDIDRHERAISTALPRKSLGQDLDHEEIDEEDEEEEEGHYEGNSMTLKDILLQADATQYDLLQQHEVEDDSFEW